MAGRETRCFLRSFDFKLLFLKLKTLIVILGPTGVGKTDISLHLAEKYRCPIISSDSRQIFKELKIGTAAPAEEEFKRVKHYFIGTHSIFDTYSAGRYEEDAIKLLNKLFKMHDVVLLVGGSMMYIDAVCNGMDNIPQVKSEIRRFWQKEYAEKGLEFIQNELKRLDEKHYSEVDLKNPKRILHALEICTQTGKTFSEFRTGHRKQRDFNIIKIGLNRPRTELYERINQRVDMMMQQGLLDEARPLYPYKHLNTLNTVGYKELYKYLDGDWTLDFAVNMIKQDSRHYAKRQLTWFNRDTEIHWFHPEEEEKIISFIDEKLK
ncbi:tRNA dimethylallyltransferase 1 [uncultured Paludibacter sp.]|uniref:tRNA dimethylallyltransferase n=1 Tax=uncultured Paludibacter sp. TaxID=497635 RepID=A0A653AJB3_9BACT|nr:tRNA dimethylallyltransferase 1 [uncultured Paludibacter sp.]